MSLKCVYGFSLAQNRLYHVLEAIALDVNDLVCPSCLNPVITVNGSIRAKHFRHHLSEEMKKCSETSLHIRAKILLSGFRSINIPIRDSLSFLRINNEVLETRVFELNNPSGTVLKSAVELSITSHGVIPDCTLEVDFGNGESTTVNYEVFVTHAVDEQKREKIKNTGQVFIEIDLSDLDYDIDDFKLEEALLDLKRHSFKSNRPAPEKFSNKLGCGWLFFGSIEAESQYHRYISEKTFSGLNLYGKTRFETLVHTADGGSNLVSSSNDNLGLVNSIAVNIISDSIVCNSDFGEVRLDRRLNPYPPHDEIPRLYCKAVLSEIENEHFRRADAVVMAEISSIDKLLSETIAINDYPREVTGIFHALFKCKYSTALSKVFGNRLILIVPFIIDLVGGHYVEADHIVDSCFKHLATPCDSFESKVSSMIFNIRKNFPQEHGGYIWLKSDVQIENKFSRECTRRAISKLSAHDDFVTASSMDRIEFSIKKLLINLCELKLLSRGSNGSSFGLGAIGFNDYCRTYFSGVYYKKIMALVSSNKVCKESYEMFNKINSEYNVIKWIPGNRWAYGYSNNMKLLTEKFQ